GVLHLVPVAPRLLDREEPPWGSAEYINFQSRRTAGVEQCKLRTMMVNKNHYLVIFISILLSNFSSTKPIEQQQQTFAIEPQTTTLIDLLSKSEEHSKLLQLIQITRLVPLINSLTQATLFAPTNQALDSSELVGKLQQDNQQLELRQTLLYHLLNFTLPDSIPTESTQSLDSLLFPVPFNADQEVPLLGHQPQKLRIIQRDLTRFIGVNARGQGGISLPDSSEFQNATNGIMIPIQSILSLPPSLKTIIKTHPELSTYSEILPDQFLDQLELLPHLTLFAPQNSAWNNLSSIELDYLKSNFSADDSIKLFRLATADNVLGNEGIGYSDLLRHESDNHKGHSFDLLSIDGNHLSIGFDRTSKQLSINGSEIVEQDILASNGVLHILPNLLIPSGNNPLELTAEKYLIGLNCTKFVSLFRQANLSTPYLDNQRGDDQKGYTILAVRDDVLGSSTSSIEEYKRFENSVDRLNNNDTESLSKSLKYHVIEGNYLMEDLKDGLLLKTELKFGGESKQRIPVSVATKGQSISMKSSIIGFGGANVVGGDPVKIGNTVIYILSQIVQPPSDLIQVALSDIRFSTGVASIFSAKLDHEFKNISQLTYLMPTNKAFSNLGLIMDYLLLEKSKSDLIQVLRYHGILELVYLNELKIGNSQRYPTIEGSELYITVHSSNNVSVHGPTIGGVALNGERQDSEVLNKRDKLIENGSMQFINQVELPSGVNIGIRKLMMGAKATTMLELIQSSNLSWILDYGSPPPSPSSKNSNQGEEIINLGRGYTILCPSDTAFTQVNLTYYLEDRSRLESLIRQHIIPVYPDDDEFNSKEGVIRGDLKSFEPLYIKDGLIYPTLLSIKEGGNSRYGDISFRSNKNHPKSSLDDKEDHEDQFDRKWLVGIKGAQSKNGLHDSSRIINFGRASPKIIPSSLSSSSSNDQVSFAGGVLLLDMVLEPYYPSFWDRIGKFILVSCVFFFLLSGLAFFGWKGWKKYVDLQNKNKSTNGYLVVEPMEE
ncbi:hypothetical protein MJO29_000364, partial [Puccinia striiformis f. sp. tritici]